MNKIFKLTVICLLFLVSCNEDKFLTEAPLDAIYAENLYQTYSGFNLGMNAVYSKMRESKTDNDKLSFWVQATDNVGSSSGGVDKFLDYTTSWGDLSENYDWLYQVINSTNLIISRAEGDVDWEGKSEEEDLANKNSAISKALVARAWAYRLLIYAFGPVPLSTEEITGATFSNGWDRNSIEEIKEQMRVDLVFAVDNLPMTNADNTQINGAVARHYLGELYLSLGEFQKAVDVLKPLCEGGDYSLVQGRIGRTASNNDGSHFMDVIRNPYTSQGNTETFFVFANGLDVPGSSQTKLHQSYNGQYDRYKKFSPVKKDAKKKYALYEKFGGKGGGQLILTPGATLDKTTYELYDKYRDVPPTSKDRVNVINRWLWTNTDGRDNYLFEMDDIRGQGTSIRRVFAYDFNGDGVFAPAKYSLEEIIAGHEEKYIDRKNDGDTIYNAFIFQENSDGNVGASKKWSSLYSRKWDMDNTLTYDWLNAGVSYHDVGYLRLAESILLYAEALFMNGNPGGAAIWINEVRERSNASTIDAGDVSIDFILDERSRELIAEEERRITLLRTGKYIERVKKYNPKSKYYVEDKHTLYPFPLEAIQANKDNLLDQNAGYGTGGSTTVDFTPAGYPDEGLK